jgi:membrane protease YdiL (CAAX protease family)
VTTTDQLHDPARRAFDSHPVAAGLFLAAWSGVVGLVGIIAAELVRRSGSSWPAVAVHTVNNLALPIFVMITGAMAVG